MVLMCLLHILFLVTNNGTSVFIKKTWSWSLRHTFTRT